MNFRNLFIGAVAMLSLAACSKSDTATAPAAVNAPANETTDNVNAYEAGTPNFSFSIDSRSALVDGNAIDDKSFEGFPTLAAQHAELEAVDKLILTKENSLELWSAGSIALALDARDYSLLHSRSGSFSIESATWAMDAGGEGQGQGLSKGTLTLNMRECMVEQEKEQDQGKPIEEEQGKPEEEGQDQGGQGRLASLGAPEEEQGKDQGKPIEEGKPVEEGQDQGKPNEQDQGKPEEKAPEVCRTLVYTYNVSEIEQPKEQDQGKDQGKPIEEGQDQGKPVDEGKDQGKPVEEGKDQGKEEQGKPIEEGKDQGEQDQGKDQGKDQGDQGKPDDEDQGEEQ